MMLAQSSSGGGSPILILLLAMPVVLWFMMRSQKRKAAQQQELQRAAEVGDEIMTTAGIFGTIVDEDEDEGTVIVEIAPGTQIKMIRAGIARRVTEDDEYDDEYDDDANDEEDVDNLEGGPPPPNDGGAGGAEQLSADRTTEGPSGS
jgi:preprotein translocase subunit YajC